MTINPVLLVLSNQVASDSIFTALTVTWFTLLLWIIKRKSWLALIIQVIILYWAFQVRYNALYYPILSVMAFLVVRKAALHYRLAGIAASILIIAASYHSIKSTTLKATGADVFAGFSGWQMANNALFLYKHIQVNTRDFDDPELRRLDTFRKVFIDSIPDETLKKINNGQLWQSTFLWSPKSPLKQYTYYFCRKNRLIISVERIGLIIL